MHIITTPSLQSFSVVSAVFSKMKLKDPLEKTTPFKLQRADVAASASSNLCQNCHRLYQEKHYQQHYERHHHHHHKQKHHHHHPQHRHCRESALYWIKNLHFVWFVITSLLAAHLPGYCCGQQQKFRVTPHDLQVLEGAEAMLRCEVTNLAGAVQWTKDGFALGFSAVIPGFPRYSVLGDRKQGAYNLRISNASINDDAEYQCQVGPARLNSAIRANAKLTVISPPSSIEIKGYTNNAKVEVRENQDLTLKCIVSNSKPASQIVWYRGNVEYKPEHRNDKVEETSPKRFTTTSSLKLKPTADDDYTEYTCQAKHKALAPDMPMRSTVQLSVLYPPGPPYIEGYTQGETLRRGQNVELICRSRGGNPPAQLIWYKNGSQIRMAYRTSGRLSENIYTFTAEASDNKARFRCEASNVMSQTPLKAEVDLTVLFAPTHVSISGTTEARVGDVVPLTCTTAASNPPAEIKWMVGGRQIRNATSRTTVSPEGGWITISNITAVIEPNKRSLVVICHGLNMQLTENVVSTHTVNVLYPPSPPIISGYMEGQIIPAGSVQKLLCVSSGGNPLATLTWYKNDKRINSIIRTADKSVSAEITILANVTDNQAQYRCEASNSATEIPLFESTTLSVHFAPETVKIRIEPEELKPGIEATIICDSSSSNPPAKLSWWKDGIPIEGINNSSKPGLWGGTVSTLEFKVNITQEMNGIVYTCQSANEALQRSVHEAISLDVLYRPKFVPPPSSTAVGVEGESLLVALQANANPMSITYSWSKDGQTLPSAVNGAEPRIFAEDSKLNFTKLIRSDAGLYVCEARNSQGTARINVTVVVEYGTTIKSVSENVIVNPGEDAMLSCTVEGKPLTEDHVKWERLGYDMTIKTSSTFANGTSYLHIKDAQREDVGNFRCIADNRVANPTSRDVLLIVKFAPEIDKSPTLLRAASGTGERGRLPCRAQASPKPKFLWRQEGKDLPVNRSYKYEVEEKKIDSLTYESILIVEKVAPADYGDYECVSKNELGQAIETVRLDITSQPDTPLSLNILNVTHDSVTVAWTPGFDGGLKASYRVRFREAHREQYKYIDGLPNSHKLTITGLRMNTLYLFSVMAYNDLGESKYLPDLQKAHTKEAPPPSQPASSLGGPPTTSATPLGGTSGLLLLVGVASGITIVALNILIIGCCLHKRNQKRLKREGLELLPAELTEHSNTPNLVIIGISLAAFGFLLVNAALVAWFFVHQRRKKAETANQPGKTATIEMYAPSSYNDTVTGETLSSVSEKSESYSNDGSQGDYIDEARKKAASTYLVDNTDLPPPRYHQDGTMPALYPNNMVNARTLPHPRHNNTANIMDHRARDDQMLINKAVYIPSPSPAPPPDGSYYNMNSDRYLSYPPMKTFLFKSKGMAEDASEVIRMLMTDELLDQFNWEGRREKRALGNLTLFNTVLRVAEAHSINDELQQIRKELASMRKITEEGLNSMRHAVGALTEEVFSLRNEVKRKRRFEDVAVAPQTFFEHPLSTEDGLMELEQRLTDDESFQSMDYPTQIDFTQPMSMAHLQPVSQASMISGTILSAQPMGNGGTGTLRRGILKGVSQVPPPDVTHHTTTNLGGVQLLHDLHPLNISSTSSTLTTTSSVGNGSLMSVPQSTPKQPQSILKDPNRSKHQQQQPPTLINTGMLAMSGPPGSLQVLNIPNSAGISNNLLMTASAAYDPTNPHSLTTFNASGAAVAFTDADGHLV